MMGKSRRRSLGKPRPTLGCTDTDDETLNLNARSNIRYVNTSSTEMFTGLGY